MARALSSSLNTFLFFPKKNCENYAIFHKDPG